MRLQRMISILLMIEAKGKVKAKDMAEKLETSIRTIYRDIDILCEAGIPITTETGPNGGIRFMDGYKLSLKNIESDEIINLYLAGMGVKAEKNSSMFMNINTALLKIQNNLSSELNDDLNKITKRFYVDDNPWWGETKKCGCIDSLMQAVWGNKKIRIIYMKADGQTSERKVRPYGILVKQMEWYLIGYCEKNDDIRTFKCERITESSILDEDFIIPGTFSLEEFWRKSSSKFIKECEEREKYFVRIKFDERFKEILNDFEVYSILEEDNYIEAEVNMYKYELALDKVSRIMGCVEVLEPQELRVFVKNQLRYQSDLYDK